MNAWAFVLLSLLAISCASGTRQTDALMEGHGFLPATTKLSKVPLIKQKRNHCGPAALAMVMHYEGKNVPLKDLTDQAFTKTMKGTFQADMLSTARHQGFLVIPINNMTALLRELSDGRPVIVFQNLGFGWWPNWHYAVVTGHDFNGPDIFLHTGREKFVKTDMRYFERSWKLGGYWGMLLLPPGELSVSADEDAHLAAAAILEDLKKLDDAKISYEAILTRWPVSLGAYIGLGNIAYARQDFKASAAYLEKAVTHHSQSAIAWHNLAMAQGSAGNKAKAKESAQKALRLVDQKGRASFEESLGPWLK